MKVVKSSYLSPRTMGGLLEANDLFSHLFDPDSTISHSVRGPSGSIMERPAYSMVLILQSQNRMLHLTIFTYLSLKGYLATYEEMNRAKLSQV